MIFQGPEQGDQPLVPGSSFGLVFEPAFLPVSVTSQNLHQLPEHSHHLQTTLNRLVALQSGEHGGKSSKPLTLFSSDLTTENKMIAILQSPLYESEYVSKRVLMGFRRRNTCMTASIGRYQGVGSNGQNN